MAGAQTTLMGDLRYARSLASSRRSAYELRLAPTQYTIVRLSPSATVLTRRLRRA